MNIYCTLDTETVGGATNPTGIYHLGGIIHDRNGNIYGCFNYLIAEMLDEIAMDDYAKKNIALYEEMLCEGTATLIDTQENHHWQKNCVYQNGITSRGQKCPLSFFLPSAGRAQPTLPELLSIGGSHKIWIKTLCILTISFSPKRWYTMYCQEGKG